MEAENTVFAWNLAARGGALKTYDTDLVRLSHCVFHENVSGDSDGAGAGEVWGFVEADPHWMDTPDPSPSPWDLHISEGSPLVDTGEPAIFDPDGTCSDIGLYGGPRASEWDIDHDGYPEWWQPGEYDFGSYPAAGWDCDDRDAAVFPGDGC